MPPKSLSKSFFHYDIKERGCPLTVYTGLMRSPVSGIAGLIPRGPARGGFIFFLSASSVFRCQARFQSPGGETSEKPSKSLAACGIFCFCLPFMEGYSNNFFNCLLILRGEGAPGGTSGHCFFPAGGDETLWGPAHFLYRLRVSVFPEGFFEGIRLFSLFPKRSVFF